MGSICLIEHFRGKFIKRQPQLVLRAPLVYIASYLQMTPETLSRVRTAALMEDK